MFALITGGGTGGHVYPALALADELVARGVPRGQLRFVGAARGLEADAVPAAGYEIALLPGRGLQRRLALANVAALVGAVRALLAAWRLVGRDRPRVVVGVGGYASLPCVVAARLRRVPTVVHEQNAAPGLANRVAVRLGARAAVSLPDTPLRGAVLVGNPVRSAITRLARRPDPARPLVLVFGGSLGARRINLAVVELAERWRHRGDVRLRHVTGRRDHAECEARWAGGPAGPAGQDAALDYELLAYEDHMERSYEEASVAVCRAGAVTVAELAVAGVPAVLVPLPGAPGDHQTRNAEALAEAGAAVVVPDEECTAARLDRELDALLGAPERLDRMAEAARRLGRPGAASELADLVERSAEEVET